MKIMLVTAVMDGGGTERVIAVLSSYLAERGHEVSIVMTVGKKSVYPLHEQVTLVSLGDRSGGSLTKRLRRITSLRQQIRKDRRQVILSFGMETNLFTILAASFLPNRVLISERNDPNQCSFKGLRSMLYLGADGYVFQTQGAKEYFGKRIQSKSVVIPNPISENLPAPHVGSRTPRVVAVGRLSKQKNHALLIQAFADFIKEYPEYRLEIFGEGELRKETQEAAEELGIADHVSLPGFASDVMERVKDAAMYVLSSDYEGISNSLLEAMGVGIPVIATDCPIGGSKALIRHEDNGILVAVGDREGLASAMKRLASDSILATAMGNKALCVREQYSADTISKMWEEVIANEYAK